MPDYCDDLRDEVPQNEDDCFAARLAAPLRAAESPDPALRARVLATIRMGSDTPVKQPVALVADLVPMPVEERPATAGDRDRWWRRVTPMAGFALAACLTTVALAGAVTLRMSRSATAPERLAQVAPPVVRVDTVHMVRFVFVAPDAKSVALVGDFNGWDRTAFQLARAKVGGPWTATAALPAGRHEYAFLVDGVRWVADSSASSIVEDEFGVESSIITIQSQRSTATRRT